MTLQAIPAAYARLTNDWQSAAKIGLHPSLLNRLVRSGLAERKATLERDLYRRRSVKHD